MPGELVPDAHLVALLHQHGVTTLYTHHRDFRKFKRIRVRESLRRTGRCLERLIDESVGDTVWASRTRGSAQLHREAP